MKLLKNNEIVSHRWSHNNMIIIELKWNLLRYTRWTNIIHWRKVCKIIFRMGNLQDKAYTKLKDRTIREVYWNREEKAWITIFL